MIDHSEHPPDAWDLMGSPEPMTMVGDAQAIVVALHWFANGTLGARRLRDGWEAPIPVFWREDTLDAWALAWFGITWPELLGSCHPTAMADALASLAYVQARPRDPCLVTRATRAARILRHCDRRASARLPITSP